MSKERSKGDSSSMKKSNQEAGSSPLDAMLGD